MVKNLSKAVIEEISKEPIQRLQKWREWDKQWQAMTRSMVHCWAPFWRDSLIAYWSYFHCVVEALSYGDLIVLQHSDAVDCSHWRPLLLSLLSFSAFESERSTRDWRGTRCWLAQVDQSKLNKTRLWRMGEKSWRPTLPIQKALELHQNDFQ